MKWILGALILIALALWSEHMAFKSQSISEKQHFEYTTASPLDTHCASYVGK